MNQENFESNLVKKYGKAFSTVAMFAGLEIHDVISEFEKRIQG